MQNYPDNSYWYIADNSQLHLIKWPGEENALIWQSSTADIFIVNPLGEAIFTFLDGKSLTAKMLFDELKTMFELPISDQELLKQINHYLYQFHLLGIIENHYGNEAEGP